MAALVIAFVLGMIAAGALIWWALAVWGKESEKEMIAEQSKRDH